MSEIANAYITITPNFKGDLGRTLQRELESGSNPEQTGKSIGSKVGDGVKGGLSTLKIAMGSFLGNIATGAFDSIVGGITDIAHEAVTASDATDKFKSTLDFAGIDSSGIERLTQACQQYADETVYDLSDIQNITAQLASNNVKDFDKLAEAAGNLNAVAGGNADTFKSVGMVLTQTAGQGKLTTENWNQLADAIPGASGKIQEALLKAGAYTGNFRDAMAAGEITAEEFNQAILDLGFEDAAVEAATSASTMEGAMGNLEASVLNLLKNGFDLIKPALTTAIGALSEFIGGFTEGLGSLADSPFVTTVVQAFQDFGEQVLPVLADAWGRIQPLFASFAEAVAPVLADVFATLAQVIGQLVETALPPLVTIWEAIEPLFETAVAIVGDLAVAFGEFAAYLLDQCQPALQAIADFFIVTMPVIQGVFEGVWNACKAVIDAVWPAIETVIEGAMTAIQGIIDTVTALIQGDWEGVWNGISEFFSGIWDVIRGTVETVLGAIYHGIIEPILSGISDTWEGVWNGIKDFFSGLWDGIKSLVDGAINGVRDTISNVLDGIRSGWENAWNAVNDFVGNAWENIKNAVSSGIEGVLGFVRELPDRILGALGDLGNLLWNAGKSIIDGFLRGLQSAWDSVTGWISGIGDWIASHKGPLDYDRKLLVKNGQAIMQGLSVGLHGGFKGIMGDVSSMGSDLRKQVEKSLYPIDGSKLVGNLNLSMANAPMTASDLRGALDGMAGSSEIALYIDSKKVASTIANPIDAVLATRQSRLTRTAI